MVLTCKERYFGRQDNSTEPRHTQLIEIIWPQMVGNLGCIETMAVLLTIKVPEYVARGIEVKVTVSTGRISPDEWTAKLVMEDVTGQRTVNVGDNRYPNVMLFFESPLVARSTPDFSVMLAISCNYAWVEVTVTDVAGNVVLCPPGKVVSGTEKFS